MISIIVPVYNVEKYLLNCLKSISLQTFKDFEVIVVNDGSTDKSGSFCNDYVKIDNRFKVYHKQNGGVSSARNFALDKIQGEWVYFCDADDILYRNALETLIKNFDENVDSTMGGYIRINTHENILEENTIYEEINMSVEETLHDFYKPKYNMYNGYIWNRLFRRSIIEKNHLRFREDMYIKEDGLFLIQYLCKCNNGTYYSTRPIYKYIEHSSSAMNSKLNNINKESVSRLKASLECHKEIKRAGFAHILPLARSQISYIQQLLLMVDKSNGLDRIKFLLFIDKLIFKEIGVFIFRIYAKRFLIWCKLISN